MEEAVENIFWQEHKIRKDDSILDNKRKTTWNSNGVDFGPQKKQFKDYKNNKPELKSNGAKDAKSNYYTNKNNRNNEKRGPPRGCFNYGGDNYMKQCPTKPKNS